MAKFYADNKKKKTVIYIYPDSNSIFETDIKPIDKCKKASELFPNKLISLIDFCYNIKNFYEVRICPVNSEEEAMQQYKKDGLIFDKKEIEEADFSKLRNIDFSINTT